MIDGFAVGDEENVGTLVDTVAGVSSPEVGEDELAGKSPAVGALVVGAVVGAIDGLIESMKVGF